MRVRVFARDSERETDIGLGRQSPDNSAILLNNLLNSQSEMARTKHVKYTPKQTVSTPQTNIAYLKKRILFYYEIQFIA